MKKIIIGFLISTCALQTHASEERYISKLVRDYSETIACQLEGTSDYQENQYKAVELNSGDPEMQGYGAMYIVYWEGDVGCYGGNGTIIPNFTIVEHRGFMSANPIIVNDYKFPILDLVKLTNISGSNGVVQIEGVRYGPNDKQHQPKQQIKYTLKLVNREFVIQ
jgi:hypothetical protein